MNTPRTVQQTAAAKIILSGEHAVVYGTPAIIIPIDHKIKVNLVQKDDGKGVLIDLPDYKKQQKYTPEQIMTAGRRISNAHASYKRGEKSVTDILQTPFDGVAYVFSQLLDLYAIELDGLNVQITSNIDIGGGFGSSAALIVVLWRGLNDLYDLDLSHEAMYSLAVQAENKYHSQSSGGDIQAILHNTPIRFQKGHDVIPFACPPTEILVIQTGKPESHTGECVAQVRDQYGEDKDLKSQFQNVTQQVEAALINQDQQKLIKAVKQNHRLLHKIGVVPEKAATLIEEIESHGGAGKISGAGAIKGDQAGIVLATSEDIRGLEHKIVQDPKFQNYKIQIVKFGTHSELNEKKESYGGAVKISRAGAIKGGQVGMSMATSEDTRGLEHKIA